MLDLDYIDKSEGGSKKKILFQNRIQDYFLLQHKTSFPIFVRTKNAC